MIHGLTIAAPVVSETGNAALDRASVSTDRQRIAELTRGMAAGDEEAFREFHRCYFNRPERKRSSSAGPRSNECWHPPGAASINARCGVWPRWLACPLRSLSRCS